MPSGTRSTCYRGPESSFPLVSSKAYSARNLYNLDSFGIFLTDRHFYLPEDNLAVSLKSQVRLPLIDRARGIDIDAPSHHLGRAIRVPALGGEAAIRSIASLISHQCTTSRELGHAFADTARNSCIECSAADTSPCNGDAGGLVRRLIIAVKPGLCGGLVRVTVRRDAAVADTRCVMLACPFLSHPGGPA